MYPHPTTQKPYTKLINILFSPLFPFFVFSPTPLKHRHNHIETLGFDREMHGKNIIFKSDSVVQFMEPRKHQIIIANWAFRRKEIKKVEWDYIIVNYNKRGSSAFSKHTSLLVVPRVRVECARMSHNDKKRCFAMVMTDECAKTAGLF